MSQYLPLPARRRPVGPARAFSRRAAARRHREWRCDRTCERASHDPRIGAARATGGFPGLTAAELARYGAAWTAREIAQQPDLWLQVAQLVRAQHRTSTDSSRRCSRTPRYAIVLTGAGTSAFIGDCLAPALAVHLRSPRRRGRDHRFGRRPQLRLAGDTPTLLVSFARSGNSPESVAAVDLAEHIVQRVHHLIVTCNAEGALAACTQRLRNARVVVLPDATNDRGFAMTSSFSSMLLVAALAFGMIASGTVAQLSRAGRAVMAAAHPLAQRLALRRYERVVYLGSNALRGLAARRRSSCWS